VLAYGLVSNHFDPPYRQPMSLDTEAPLASVSAAHLYTMPDTGSVHTALDLDEALDYLRGSLNLGTLRQIKDAPAYCAEGLSRPLSMRDRS
jgi:hypothetical protein